MRDDTSPAAPGPVSYAPVRYGTSRLLFRGPRRPLEGRHIAFVGGTETFGRTVAEPFPALVERMLGETCVNLGQVNGSIDIALGDAVIAQACRDAALTVVKVMGAQNMSNRFYQVHPRRNDRLTRVSTVMQAIFPEVDFSEFCFTRHMLSRLAEIAPERFHILREELQAAWSARMKRFLEDLGSPAILLWLSPHLPSDAPWEERPDWLQRDPLFVTRRMLDALRPIAQGVAMVQPTGAIEDTDHGPAMTQAGHRQAAEAVAQMIRAVMPGRSAA